MTAPPLRANTSSTRSTPRLSVASQATSGGQVTRGWSPRGVCTRVGAVWSGPTWKPKGAWSPARGRRVVTAAESVTSR